MAMQGKKAEVRGIVLVVAAEAGGGEGIYLVGGLSGSGGKGNFLTFFVDILHGN